MAYYNNNNSNSSNPPNGYGGGYGGGYSHPASGYSAPGYGGGYNQDYSGDYYHNGGSYGGGGYNNSNNNNGYNSNSNNMMSGKFSHSSTGGLGANLQHIDFANTALAHFEKDFYIEHPAVAARTEADAYQWRAAHHIVVQGTDVPKPVYSFEEASMPEYVLTEVLKCGFSAPTPIQSQGWPMALKGRNMVGVSATGSGKTLAFLLPGMIHINAQVCVYVLFCVYLVCI
jgi:ATP-dependent RNA helicase DDX5/DBP2